MTLYVLGSEISAIVPSDSDVLESTETTGRNPDFSRASVNAPKTTTYGEGDPGAAVVDAWLHCRIGVKGLAGTVTTTRLIWLDNSDVERVRLRYTYVTSLLELQHFNGAWVTAGSATVNLDNTSQDIDLHVECNNATGSVQLYVAGTQRINATIDTTAIASLRKARFYGYLPPASVVSYNTYVSQLLVADEPTIGIRLSTLVPTGAGASTDFVGTFAEVDELAYSDADFVNTSTANHVELFTHSTTLPPGYTVRAVAVTARAKRGASGPANLQLALRSAGTTYVSGSKALDVGYGGFGHVWENDPATAAAFTSSAISALQFGVKAIA